MIERLRKCRDAVSARVRWWVHVTPAAAATVGGILFDFLDGLKGMDISPLMPADRAAKVIAVIGVLWLALHILLPAHHHDGHEDH